MATTQIGAQLYTLRDFTKTPKDVATTIAKVKQLGYDAVQVSAFGPIDPGELKQIVDGEGVTIAATHIPWPRMRDEPQAVIDEHQLWGCRHTAIGGLPDDFRSEEGYARFAKEANQVAARLKQGGLTFSYHNHGFEFQRYNGTPGLELLIQAGDPELVNFEIDTYWVQFGGGDPAQWIERVSGRIPLLHVKDMTANGWEQAMAEVGEGNLNWPRILDASRAAGVEWYLVEQDVCSRDPFDCLKTSLENLKAMGLS